MSVAVRMRLKEFYTTPHGNPRRVYLMKDLPSDDMILKKVKV